jgi:hypothetical protein
MTHALASECTRHRDRGNAVDDAAEQLGLSSRATWKYIGTGDFRVVRFGKRTLILDSEIARLQREGFAPRPNPPKRKEAQ